MSGSSLGGKEPWQYMLQDAFKNFEKQLGLNSDSEEDESDVEKDSAQHEGVSSPGSQKTPTPEDIKKAEEAKLAADGLYRSGQCRKAFEKYTEAIKATPANPILYSNRAAASLSLRDYEGSRKDAEKAVKLDPNYTKAWGRLGAALNALNYWPSAIDAWETALKSLPKTNLSEIQIAMKRSYETELQKAIKGKDALIKPIPANASTGDMHFHRAEKMEEQLVKKQEKSSAFTISKASSLWLTGVWIMIESAKDPRGRTGAITALCDAILMDRRSMMPDGDFLQMYPVQVENEFRGHKSWKNATPKFMKAEIVRRLEKSDDDWEALKSTLELALKYKVFDSFLQFRLQPSPDQKSLKNAIEIIEWVREEWPNVGRQQRGDCFERYFLRAAKALLLRHQFENHMRTPVEDMKMEGPEWRETIDLAHEVLAEAEEFPENVRFYPKKDGKEIVNKFAHLDAYELIPKSEAHSLLARYWEIKAMKTPENSKHIRKYWEKSAHHISEACRIIPHDDETYLYHLERHLQVRWRLAEPVSVTLPIMEEIEKGIPRCKKIWEMSWVFRRTLPTLEQPIAFAGMLRSKLAEGSITTKSVVNPKHQPPIAAGKYQTIPLSE